MGQVFEQQGSDAAPVQRVVDHHRDLCLVRVGPALVAGDADGPAVDTATNARWSAAGARVRDSTYDRADCEPTPRNRRCRLSGDRWLWNASSSSRSSGIVGRRWTMSPSDSSASQATGLIPAPASISAGSAENQRKTRVSMRSILRLYSGRSP